MQRLYNLKKLDEGFRKFNIERTFSSDNIAKGNIFECYSLLKWFYCHLTDIQKKNDGLIEERPLPELSPVSLSEQIRNSFTDFDDEFLAEEPRFISPR